MTAIKIFKANNVINRITIFGHSGYAEEDEDIVCAGISVLTINLINSLEKLSKDIFDVKENDETGYLDITLSYDDMPEYSTEILIQSYLIGIESLLENYSDYLSLEIEEV